MSVDVGGQLSDVPMAVKMPHDASAIQRTTDNNVPCGRDTDAGDGSGMTIELLEHLESDAGAS